MDKNHSIKEFRVVLPMTVEEYRVGQLWSVAETSKMETGGGDGVEVIVNEPFTAYRNRPTTRLFCNGQAFIEGQYSHKIYHLNKKVPGWVKVLAPTGTLQVHEQSWNAYPFARTVITNPGSMKDSFYLTIETYHAGDCGNSNNIHNLAGRDLRERKVVMIDIANDKISSKDYRPEWDPCLVGSFKAKRPPIAKDGTGAWMSQVKPVMCCYKLVKVWFKWFGLQNKIEHFILSQERRIFFLFHRQVWCWLDRYYGLTLQDIRVLEEEVKRDLQKRREAAGVKGMGCDDT